MLKNHKVLKLAILICLCLIIISIPVVAAVSAPEITISTDKTEYTGDDTITAVIDVNNVTGNDMKDIVISGAVPTGYATDDGVAGPDNWSAKLSKVAAGSTESVTIKFTKQVTFKVSSTVERSILAGVQDADNPGDWFGGNTPALTTAETEYSFTFTMTKDCANSALYFSMGSPIDSNGIQPASIITISDVQLVEVETN